MKMKLKIEIEKISLQSGMPQYVVTPTEVYQVELVEGDVRVFRRFLDLETYTEVSVMSANLVLSTLDPELVRVLDQETYEREVLGVCCGV